MKKFILIIFLLILASTLISCDSSEKLDVRNLQKSTYDASLQSKNVMLSINEKIITKETEAITLKLTNVSNEKYIFGADLHLEVEIDGIYYIQPTLENIAWPAIGYILLPKESREIDFLIISNYGPLNPANYRIIKQLSSDISNEEFVVAEFQIQK